MNRIMAFAAAMFLVFAVASVSIAAQVTGEVKAVDKTAKTITVAKKVKDKVTETVISVDDKILAEMKTGTKVTVKYTTADGKNTAKSVNVKKAGAKKTESAKPAAAPAEKKAPAKAGGY